MELTTEMLQKYVGGQMEIQNTIEQYIYRGEIKTIAVINNTLKVKFNWVAKGDGFPPIPHKWVKEDTLDYGLGLEICAVSDIGNDRLCLDAHITGELCVLYPLGGSKLDPAKVEGLKVK